MDHSKNKIQNGRLGLDYLVFEWLGPELNDYGPSKYRTCSVFEPPLYSYHRKTVHKKTGNAKNPEHLII